MNLRRRNVYIRWFLIWRAQHMSERAFLLWMSVLLGILAALGSIFLKTAVAFLHTHLQHDQKFDFTDYLALAFPTVGIALTVALKKWVLRDNIKHNITAILYAISRRNSIMQWHKVFSSLVGGILTAGFGGSIGLEAPIISSGSSMGSNLARLLRVDYRSATLLLACGATGAMSAIFHTPITALVFALEVLLIDISQFTLIPLLLASISGALVSKIIQEPELVFELQHPQVYLSILTPFYVLFGIYTGLWAVYFTRVYVFFENKFERIARARHRLLIGGLGLGLLIFLFPPFYGEGFATIRHLLNNNLQPVLHNSLFAGYETKLWVLLIFLSLLAFLKIVATAGTIGAGGMGGIFAPALFTGAVSGYVFARLVNLLGFFTHLRPSHFVLVGMAAMLGGVLHAPLTGVFLIAEITGGYSLIVPLMLSTTVTYITVKYLQPDSIITVQLAAKGDLITHHKDKAVLHLMDMQRVIETDLKLIAPQQTLGQLVQLIAHSARNIFPVVDSKKQLHGVVYLDDVREIMFDKSQYDSVVVRNLMRPVEITVETSDHMAMVMQKFKQSGAWNLPVVQDGCYVGFVSKSKIFMVYRQLLVDISAD